MSSTPPPQKPRVEALQIVKMSYGYVLQNWKIFALPAVSIFLFTDISSTNLQASLRDGTATDIRAYLALFANNGNLVSLIAVWPFILVNVHRRILHHEVLKIKGITFFDNIRSVSRYLGTAISICLLNFILYSAVLLVLAPLIKYLTISIFGIGVTKGDNHLRFLISVTFGMLFPIVACIPLVARLSLALPASAIGNRQRLAASWRATRGNVMRMSGALVLTGLPLAFIGVVVIAPFIFEGMSAVSHGQAAFSHVSAIAIGGFALVTTLAPPIFAVMLSFSYEALAAQVGSQSDTLSSEVPA